MKRLHLIRFNLTLKIRENKARLLIKLDVHRDNKVMRLARMRVSLPIYLDRLSQVTNGVQSVALRILFRLFSNNRSYNKLDQTEIVDKDANGDLSKDVVILSLEIL